MAQRKSGKSPSPSVSRSAYLGGGQEKGKSNRLVSGDGPITEGGKGDARRLEPTVTTWNDHDSREVPPAGPTPEQAAAERAAMAAAADGGMPTTVTSQSREDDERGRKIRELLGRETKLETKGELSEETTEGEAGGEGAPAGGETATTTEPPAPTRRDRLANLDAQAASEKKRLATERELGAERKRRQELEAELAGTDVLAFAKRRGMTRDQAIDALMEAKDTAAAAGAVAPDPMKAINDRVAGIEARERAVANREAESIVLSVTKDLDIPVTRAMKRVTVTSDDGTSEVMSGIQLVTATARRLWEQAGSPEGGVAPFLKEAAPLVEEQLISDQKEVLEAYAAKRALAPATPAKGKTAPPALGRRTGAGGGPSSGQPAVKLSDDEDERHAQIKARFGFR